MWIIPSRSRPHSIERLLSSDLRPTFNVLLRVDDDDPLLGGYSTMRLPPNWKLDVGARMPFSDMYNDIWARYPNEVWYGWLADDVLPETEAWEEPLIQAAGYDRMAVPLGSHDPRYSPHFVLGKNLVLSAGWLALPGLSRLYVDTAWQDIARERGVYVEVQVVLRHLHFSNGLALRDATYRKPDAARDRAVYEAWRRALAENQPR